MIIFNTYWVLELLLISLSMLMTSISILLFMRIWNKIWSEKI